VQPNKHGVITRAAIERTLNEDTSLVSVMHLNNELGTANPIDEIGALCFEHGVKLHSDAAQSFLKLPVNVEDMSVDFLSISAHKIGGPKGVGAIYIRDRRGRDIEPVIHGAGQEEGLRGGTLPTPLISSFAKAVETFPNVYNSLRAAGLKHQLLESLSELDIPYTTNGVSIDSLVSLTLPDSDVPRLLRETNHMFALATGSACSSTEIETSHVLMALGIGRELADRTLRISFSHLHNRDDIRKLAQQIAIHSGR
jgi:cysteine desulfurase